MDERIRDIVAQAADPDGGLREMGRFDSSYRETTGFDFDYSSEGALALARIFGNCPALAVRLIKNPHWADEVAGRAHLAGHKPAEVIAEELSRALQGSRGRTEFMRALRRFKYRQMLRLVARDLASRGTVREMLAEWSFVADAVIHEAWIYAHEEVAKKHGEPTMSSEDGQELPCAGCVMALGKLGGRELNLSSDVDLLILYSSDAGGAGGITNQEFFVEQTAIFTRLLSDVTEDGFAFRVDHELRPEGHQGTLANSLDAALRYYEYFGHDWERQALIRARPVAGDRGLGDCFVEAVRPFVYRRSMTLADIAHMRRMKRQLERAAKRRSATVDVKHGRGGIREVEFLTQAMCLLFGGNIKSIRTGNTFEAIEALARESLIHPYGAQTLTDAYSFLRRTENMLQAAHDRQTHRLPGRRRELLGLARRLGYGGEERRAVGTFESELARHTESAGSLFDAIFTANYERQELMDAIRDNAARAQTEEERVESLAWFKKREVRRIQELELTRGMPLDRVLERLTLAAEATVACSYEIASDQLQGRYGRPTIEGAGPAGFAVVGMGSLGSREMDYGSDLDLCFLYAGPGRTDGKTSIANVEHFSRLAQRMISMLSMAGRYGRAYRVDSELRPSGQAGTLVATLDSFREYHLGQAGLWERRSLMKARAIAGDGEFLSTVRGAIEELAFKRTPPDAEEIKSEIRRLRDMTIQQRVSPREDVYEIKLGRGGLADVEAVIQMRQMSAAHCDERLRVQSTARALCALSETGAMDPETARMIESHLTFYRTLLMRVRQALGRSADVYSTKAPYAEKVAEQMGEPTPEALAASINEHMREMASIYAREVC